MAATNKSKRQALARDFKNGDVSVEDFVNRIWEERTAAEEQWRKDHMRMHELEREALTLAREMVARELTHLNQLRQDVVEDRNAFVRKDAFDNGNETNRAKFSQVEEKFEAANRALEKALEKANSEIQTALDKVSKDNSIALDLVSRDNEKKFGDIDRKIAFFMGGFAVVNFIGWALVVMHENVISLFSK